MQGAFSEKGERSRKILVVEDDEILAAEIELLLQRVGCSVVAKASCFEEALSMALESKPDLILMDIFLKGERDGVEAAKAILRKTSLPIVYMTAATDREHMVWHLKYTMLSSRMLIRPEPKKMGKCFHLMRNTCRWNRPNTTVSTSSVPKFRINTRLPSDTPTPVSRRLENPIKPQHTALRIT